MREGFRSMAALTDDAPVEEVIRRAHELLADAPSAIVTATLEDALAVRERPNMPGAPADSWTRALPSPLEELKSHPRPQTVARCFENRSTRPA